MKKLLISIIRVSIIVFVIVLIFKFFLPSKLIENIYTFNYTPHKHHFYDKSGILSKYDTKKFEEYLDFIFNESDIDIRFMFLKNCGDKAIEEVAVNKVQELGIGKDNREKRGVLLLYDVENRKLKVEIGYGLEGYFTDAFVSYLVHFHTKEFFESQDITTGLRLLLFILHHRIRSEILEKNFDPTIVDIIKNRGYLSGGGGVSSKVVKNGKRKSYLHGSTDSVNKNNYIPQSTPGDVYQKYLEWLSIQKFDPNIEIFTKESQQYMNSLPMTKAYFHYILIQEYGKKYKIDIRDNLALLFFTDDPLVSPHFFIKDEKGWRMDIVAEVQNTRNRVGGVYTWDYGGVRDAYTKTFLDKFIIIKNYIRISDGDNRELPIRGS
jgi:hypothetical protein